MFEKLDILEIFFIAFPKKFRRYKSITVPAKKKITETGLES